MYENVIVSTWMKKSQSVKRVIVTIHGDASVAKNFESGRKMIQGWSEL